MLVRVSNANVKANMFHHHHHHKTCTIVHDDFHLHHHLHHLHHLHHHVHNDFQPFPCSTLAHQLNLSRPWAFPLCARHGRQAAALEEKMGPRENLYPTNLISRSLHFPATQFGHILSFCYLLLYQSTFMYFCSMLAHCCATFLGKDHHRNPNKNTF